MSKVLKNFGKPALCFLLCFIMFLLPLSINSAPVSVKAEEQQSRVIVSMGDSFSAGEGIDPFYDENLPLEERVNSYDWLAHRSEKSWPGRLKLPSLKGTMAENRENGNWFFVAASGAVTADFQDEQRKDYKKKTSKWYEDDAYLESYEYLPSQLSVFEDPVAKNADYVTMTIGGNDAEFKNIVELVGKDSFYLNPNHLVNKLSTLWDNFYAEDGIRDNIQQAYLNVMNAAPQAKVIVAGYPRLFDELSSFPLISTGEALVVNDAVSQFNRELQTIVNSCKAMGKKICFVSVEEKFKGHQAYSYPFAGKYGTYINGIVIPAKKQDLKDDELISAYSIHPNSYGAQVYADCVQDKIDQIEKDGGKSEWPDMQTSDERDVVLVLDKSGSMDGSPLGETKEASEKFVDTVLQQDASIGIVTYDESAMTISDFCMNEQYLKNAIQSINAGGSTNIDDGLTTAYYMLQRSNAKKKIIVLMSDGEPNCGRQGESLIEWANTIKDEGIYIYTLGFFGYSGYMSDAQALMEKIASDGCHYEVDDAENLVFFFDDIANQIQGKKYIYVRIACPVDVTVEYKGETLSSIDASSSQRTSYGTLTFEDSENYYEDSSDDRVKVLRLKEGADYKIRIKGNGSGQMNYTIGFMDDQGEYTDMRKIENIEITQDTSIDTVAKNSNTTVLNVDENGDGRYDRTYKVNKKGYVEPKENNFIIYWIIAIAILLGIIVVVKLRKNKKGTVVATAAASPVTATPASTTQSTDIFCRNCGATRNAQEIYCKNCGTRFK